VGADGPQGKGKNFGWLETSIQEKKGGANEELLTSDLTASRPHRGLRRRADEIGREMGRADGRVLENHVNDSQLSKGEEASR